MFKKFNDGLKKVGRGIKNTFKFTHRNTRASLRASIAVVAVPAVLALLVPLQALIVGPVFRNRTFLPKMFNKMMCGLLGLRVVFNKKSAPLAKGKPTMNMINHRSWLDIFVVGSTVDGAFVGKGELLKKPALAWLLKVANFIGVRRRREFNPQSNGKIVKHLNSGESINIFPEATVVTTGEVAQFRAGLLEPLYGGEAVDKKGVPVTLEKEVATQAFALNVVRLNGHVRGADEGKNSKILGFYCDPAPNHGMLVKIWKCMQMNQTIELTAFPAREPDAYQDARELANHAAQDVASVVNPGQAEFKPAKLPFTTPPKAA